MSGFVGTAWGMPRSPRNTPAQRPELLGETIPDGVRGHKIGGHRPPYEGETVTKADLISKVAETTENTKTDCDAILTTAFNAIAEELKTGGSFAWPQFGKFEVVIRAARKGVNPATKQPIAIPQTTAVKFKAALALKEGVKG